jgi:Squalene-hopene cyclase C-terminal domain/Prenyltransferase and squalene oxidase repeat
MRTIGAFMCLLLLAVAALWAQGAATRGVSQNPPTPEAISIEKGAKWLAAVQGSDGGWGQDGGETSYVRTGERLESNGNDVANTAVAALALLQAGNKYRPNVERALDFILKNVEESPAAGLAITNRQGTQIQRKLGPYIDTFLTSMLLARVDGTLSSAMNARVRRALEKCVAKIEQNQLKDGSWNISGGWAPILGTSMASRSLFDASQKGVKVDDKVMRSAEDYTVMAMKNPAGTGAGGAVGGATTGVAGGVSSTAALSVSVSSASAGVPLYQTAQALEQLSRTEADRKKNASEISRMQAQLKDARFVEGFGSIGGEEFFSYLNVSDSLQRSGAAQWKEWHSQMAQKILNLQNSDGTWAGHHCITGRVAVTSAAILNLKFDHAN